MYLELKAQLPMEFETSQANLPHNILPFDGECLYFGQIFSQEQANSYMQFLLKEIPWQHDEAKIYGKHIVTARKVAWFGDAHYNYTYSGRTRTARVWTPELLAIKTEVERIGGSYYNSCLLNLYADGTQGMSWHHDDEKGLGHNSDIASVSFGVTRRFDLRHKTTKEKVSINLQPGSLLIMRGSTQACWQHQLAKTTKILQPRINLTFRRMLISDTFVAQENESGLIR